MSFDFQKYDPVYSADEAHLGDAITIYQRTEGIDPDLLYYEYYLHVASLEAGNQYYIPLEFVTDRDLETGRTTLAVKLETVKNNTWDRMPDFVAFDRHQEIDLTVAHDWI